MSVRAAPGREAVGPVVLLGQERRPFPVRHHWPRSSSAPSQPRGKRCLRRRRRKLRDPAADSRRSRRGAGDTETSRQVRDRHRETGSEANNQSHDRALRDSALLQSHSSARVGGSNGSPGRVPLPHTELPSPEVPAPSPSRKHD